MSKNDSMDGLWGGRELGCTHEVLLNQGPKRLLGSQWKEHLRLIPAVLEGATVPERSERIAVCFPFRSAVRAPGHSTGTIQESMNGADWVNGRDLVGFKAVAILQTCFEFASMGRRSRHVASMARAEEGVRNAPMTVVDGEANRRTIGEENV